MYRLVNESGKTFLKLIVPKIKWDWVEEHSHGFYRYEKDSSSGYEIGKIENSEVFLRCYWQSTNCGCNQKFIGWYTTIEEAMLEVETFENDGEIS